MDFLQTPLKIRELRKQLQMKQYELADENLTAAFISMLELGKRGLSRETASKIAEKLNEKAKKIGISLDIDADYLLFTPQQEAEHYCLKKLKEINSIEETGQLIAISKKYNLYFAESMIHKFIARKLYDEKNYQSAFFEYQYALDLYKSANMEEELPYLYNRCGLCCLQIINYKTALFFFQRAEHYLPEGKNDKLLGYITYNLGLCNKKLSNIKEAIKYTKKYLSQYSDSLSDFDVFLKAKVLLSNCYEKEGKLEESINIYADIIRYIDSMNYEQAALVYTNLGDIYSEKGDYDKSLEYLNKAQNIRDTYNKYKLPLTLIEKSKVYMKQCKIDTAMLMLNLAIETATMHSNKCALLDSYRLLKEIYKAKENSDAVKEINLRLVEILLSLELSDYSELIGICNELAKAYLSLGDMEESKKYLEIIEYHFQKL